MQACRKFDGEHTQIEFFDRLLYWQFSHESTHNTPFLGRFVASAWHELRAGRSAYWQELVGRTQYTKLDDTWLVYFHSPP